MSKLLRFIKHGRKLTALITFLSVLYFFGCGGGGGGDELYNNNTVQPLNIEDTIKNEIKSKAIKILPAEEYLILEKSLENASETELRELNNSIDQYLDAESEHEQKNSSTNLSMKNLGLSNSFSEQNIAATKSIFSDIFGNLNNEISKRTFLNAGMGFRREAFLSAGGSITGTIVVGETFILEAGAGPGVAYDFLNFKSYNYTSAFCAGSSGIAIGLHAGLSGELNGVVAESCDFWVSKGRKFSW